MDLLHSLDAPRNIPAVLKFIQSLSIVRKNSNDSPYYDKIFYLYDELYFIRLAVPAFLYTIHLVTHNDGGWLRIQEMFTIVNIFAASFIKCTYVPMLNERLFIQL